MAINNKTGDAQDALIDFLVGALRPFVKHWEPWMDDPHHGDDDYMSSFARVQFKDVRRARAALLASSVAAPVAIPAPAVDAVPAGEVSQHAAARLAEMVDHGRIDAAYGNFIHPAATMIDDVRKLLAALSHGEGR